MSKAKAGSKNQPKPVAAKRKGGKYQMPDPLPIGEILTDLNSKKWKLGTSIGKGGFGEIYSATDVASGKNSYVIKIEPKENGPLFVEMHFFMKVCKSEDIDKWMSSKKLKFLGLPRFVGNGSHQHNGKSYRFVVMEKFGKNLDAVLKENKNVLPSNHVFQIALMILDALEYIHSKGYVHADIKGGNLLLGLNKGAQDQIYLVDFGLASKYSKDFKPDPKCAHNGTIEFTSRDAHVGATTRRGDLEILAYNMLRWFISKLPWENKLSDCSYVQQQKINFMKNIPEQLKKCFGSQPVPDALKKFFEYIVQMAPTADPDYELIQSFFKEGLKMKVISGSKKVSSPTKRSIQDTKDVSKKTENGDATEQPEIKKPNTKKRSPTKPTKRVETPSDDTCDTKSTRPVRTIRKVNHVANGYVPESDSFSEESEDEDDRPLLHRKPIKRPSNENKKVKSPKKKKNIL